MIRNNWLIAACVGFFLFSAVGCHTAHKEKKPAKEAKRPTTVTLTQTGSNLTRKVTLSDDEESDADAKSKKKKKEPVDQDYVPRGGFR